MRPAENGGGSRLRQPAAAGRRKATLDQTAQQSPELGHRETMTFG
jgi:hypothetical protein